MELGRVRFALSKTAARAPVVWARHIGISERDVFIASYPRTGNTWLRFVLHHALTGERSEFDCVNRRIPQIGYRADAIRLPSGGRMLKTHEAYRSEYNNAIYIARDPRDVVMSEYKYLLARGLIGSDLDGFVKDFLRGKVNGNGSWQAHTQGWLDAAELSSRIMVVRFEDMRREPLYTIRSIVEFLGVPSDMVRIAEAVADNTIERMREKEVRHPQRVSRKGRFIGAGAVGGWQRQLHSGLIKVIENSFASEMARIGYQSGMPDETVSQACK